MNSLLRLASKVGKGFFYSRVRFDLTVIIDLGTWDGIVRNWKGLCRL